MKKGITLVALVVTIIILLILATVTISLILGENSLFGRVGEGKEKTELAQTGERIQNSLAGLMADLSAGLQDMPETISDARTLLQDNVASMDKTLFGTPSEGTTFNAGTPTSGVPSTMTYSYIKGNYKLELVVDFINKGVSYSVVNK